MVGPGFPRVGGVEGDDQLARGVNWVGVKVKWGVVYACPGREGGVGGVGAEVVEGEFRDGNELIPFVGGEVRMGRGEDGDEVVFARADAPLRRQSAVDARGDKLDGEVLGLKKFP